jgi:hypothetical protein
MVGETKINDFNVLDLSEAIVFGPFGLTFGRLVFILLVDISARKGIIHLNINLPVIFFESNLI